MAEKETEQAPSATKEHKWTDSLPPWISSNLTSKKSWKILFRCWLAAWASFVLILPGSSLRVIGNAYVHLTIETWVTSAWVHHRGFFAMLGAIMLPPSMPVQAFILVSPQSIYVIIALSCPGNWNDDWRHAVWVRPTHSAFFINN